MITLPSLLHESRPHQQNCGGYGRALRQHLFLSYFSIALSNALNWNRYAHRSLSLVTVARKLYTTFCSHSETCIFFVDL